MVKTLIDIHITNLISNMKEVDRLSDIHAKITNPGPGRKHAVEVLHKSSIVLLVACWEAFVEDAASRALEFMIEMAGSHREFPITVLEKIANKHPGKKAWELAGDGWKRAMRNNLSEILAKTTGTLNTPKTDQVNVLFEKTIGLKNLSSSWRWRGRQSRTSELQLDRLVSLRGEIAHRVSATNTVRKQDVSEAREFIARLAVKSNNTVNRYVTGRIGKEPFGVWHYNQTR